MYGCIDIGSNTTRLLVAEVIAGRVRTLAARRVFTRIGASVDPAGRIPADKVAETARVAAALAAEATELGAERTVLLGTAAVRQAANGDELCARIEATAGLPMRVLSGDEEAQLSFWGARAGMEGPAVDRLGVVDVGGGSTELAIGSPDGTVEWSESFRIGSGFLADAYLRSDPPSVAELSAVREHVAGAFEGLDTPAAETAVAVGGTATSLRRLVGAELAHETLERGVRVLSLTTIREIAERFELDAERVRLLPAGILVLEAVSDQLGLPLRIARGGLREGVILELVEAV